MEQQDLFPCQLCPKTFPSAVDAERHMWAVNHYRNRCARCHERFPNGDALQNHMTSGVHRECETLCPFCGKSFNKASVLVAHFENARCANAPGLDHHTIVWLIRNCDTLGVMTNAQTKSFLWSESVSKSTENGDHHECFACHRTFQTHQELESHLRTPTGNPEAHGPRFYRCPSRNGRCHKNFVNLADLFKHLEAQTCGAMSFDAVQRIMQELTRAAWGWGTRAPRVRFNIST